MIDFAKIKMFREKINQLILERPELEHLQREIDKALSGIKDKTNRCVVVSNMMCEAMQKMGKEMEVLVNTMKSLKP